ncbi:MAG: hypothetical protein ACR2HE_06910 [Casimicrobiaceae bacterium]
MTARVFTQPSIVNALCMALAKLADAPEISASLLVQAVAHAHPHVPISVLRAIAAKVLVLYFEPITVDDLKHARLELDDEIEACKFLGAAVDAELAEFQAFDRDKRNERIAQLGLTVVRDTP